MPPPLRVYLYQETLTTESPSIVSPHLSRNLTFRSLDWRPDVDKDGLRYGTPFSEFDKPQFNTSFNFLFSFLTGTGEDGFDSVPSN